MPEPGNYVGRTTCRLCKSSELQKILDFGRVPLAGCYPKEEELGSEKLYPLTVSVCGKCSFVQINEVIDPKELYADYRYLSSIPLSKHFEEYAEEMELRFLEKGSFIVEIGSNDGVLLRPLKARGMKVLGVDPAENISKVANTAGLETITGYFDESVGRQIALSYGHSDAVFANNVLAHIDDLDTVMRGVYAVLKRQGVFVFEVYYLVDLLDKFQYDIIYHEHHSYHSLTALIPFLKKYHFEVFDAKRISTHGGSIRVYCQKEHGKDYEQTNRLKEFLELEKTKEMGSLETYKKFSVEVTVHGKILEETLRDLKEKGKRIVGYGASGRGNMLLCFSKLSRWYLEYIVDESSERFGRYTPVTNIPIFPVQKLRDDLSVDYALLLAWSYKNTILEKEQDFRDRGGKFIIPFPKIEYA